MIEKVNPMHPDKVADRIAGAIVDLGYTKEKEPKVAVEILIGHGDCNIHRLPPKSRHQPAGSLLPAYPEESASSSDSPYWSQ